MAEEICLHCALMATINEWMRRSGRSQNGKPVFDVTLAISKLTECTVEIAEMPGDRSSKRRAFRFAHDALDANLKSQRTGQLVPVEIPGEH
jgi:hypothetical protein